jgi:Xaa-Pro aminopeptidase
LHASDTLSCEPSVYIPGLGGARFENMFLIGEQEAEELTQSLVDPQVGE